jgi:hypothetical protein
MVRDTIKTMSDLPTSVMSSGSNPLINGQTQNTDVNDLQTVNFSSGNKELIGEIGIASSELTPLKENGMDIELSPEVTAVGVSVQPTTINLPVNLTQAGVQPAGQNITIGDGSSVKLPLSDDQIIAGLHEKPTSSWRWLAEWCIRKLKKLHIVIKYIQGKAVEVKTA